MAPTIKSIRGLLASVRNSIMDPGTSASLDDAMKRILGHQLAATWSDVAFSNIVKCEDGLAVLQALQNEYLIRKVVHCKKRPRKILKDVVEHEFVVVHLRHKGRDSMFRIDRAIGPKSDKDKEPSTKSLAPRSSGSSSESNTAQPRPQRSSRSSSSSVESILMYPAQLINYCVCQLSNISSSRHWARDTIVQISKIPNDAYALTTIDFSHITLGSPSLWDLVHLVQFVNQQCDEYSVVDAQCYWYADMVSGILEIWCQDAAVTRHHGWQGTKSKVLSIPAPGTCKGIPIHKRNSELISEKKAVLAMAIETSFKTTERFLDYSKGTDRTVQRIQADADAQIQLLSKQLREAQDEVRRMGEQMKQGEERAEARVNEAKDEVRRMGEQMKQGEERAEARVKAIEDRYESNIQEMKKQLQQSQERNNDLIERIMVQLSKHGVGNPITL